MRLAALIAACLTLAGCATSQQWEDIIGSWVGAPLDEVISRWGYPTGQASYGERKVYHWDRVRYAPGTVFATGTTAVIHMPGAFVCRRTLEVSPGNRVIGGQIEGNDCPALSVGADRWRR